jgi:hypothetical protein
MQSCVVSAPQLADWVKQHPAERLGRTLAVTALNTATSSSQSRA